MVKGAGGPHDPQDLPVVLLMAEQLIDGVVIHGVGGLPGAALAEGKGLRLPPLLRKTVGVDIDAVGAVLSAAHRHRLSGFQVAELHHCDLSVPQGGHTVHAALLRQQPGPPHFEVFRVDGGSVVALRRHPVPGGGQKDGVGGAAEQ